MSGFDPRLTAARPDLAAGALEGIVPAAQYAAPRRLQAMVAAAGLRVAPDPMAEMADQLLFGEGFEALEEKDGWLWGQARRDGYVGWAEAAAFGPLDGLPTHRVSALRTYAFAGPSIKTRAEGPFSLNALVRVEGREGRLAKVVGAGWMAETALVPIGVFEDDPAAVAERFLGAPYLWGGRESLGVDCSGLVQQAFLACGRACPRDSDQQAKLGRTVERDALARGDLVFWRGHVGIMLDADTLLHANAFHMAVAREPLGQAIARIEAAGAGAPTAFRRV